MELFETRQVYKVSEVTRMVKAILEDSPISQLWVEGEVSNFVHHTSGHIYFTLKDSRSQIKCAIFKNVASRLRFLPENGLKIVLFGDLTVYEARGEYQIIGNRVEPLGVGALQMAFEQLKKRLESEGLFDPSHKKPIPMVPQRVGVITSATGAAIRDILNVITRRFSNIYILLHPATVQGEGAAQEIAAAIKTMNEIGNLDVLIIGRGGGSLEDLWAFNEEIVARSIYESEIPIISAVGHEIDFTIADFVADLRAPTPSAAAEIVVADKSDLIRRLDSLNTRLYSRLGSQIQLYQRQLENADQRLLSKSGQDRINLFRQELDDLTSRAHNSLSDLIYQSKVALNSNREKLAYVGIPAKLSEMRKDIGNLEQRCISNMRHLLESKDDDFRNSVARLNALSPLSVLQRGYSICYQYLSGEVIRDSKDVSIGDKIRAKLASGEIICQVEENNIEE